MKDNRLVNFLYGLEIGLVLGLIIGLLLMILSQKSNAQNITSISLKLQGTHISNDYRNAIIAPQIEFGDTLWQKGDKSFHWAVFNSGGLIVNTYVFNSLSNGFYYDIGTRLKMMVHGNKGNSVGFSIGAAYVGQKMEYAPVPDKDWFVFKASGLSKLKPCFVSSGNIKLELLQSIEYRKWQVFFGFIGQWGNFVCGISKNL